MGIVRAFCRRGKKALARSFSSQPPGTRQAATFTSQATQPPGARQAIPFLADAPFPSPIEPPPGVRQTDHSLDREHADLFMSQAAHSPGVRQAAPFSGGFPEQYEYHGSAILFVAHFSSFCLSLPFNL
jgi:hypothetical protein